MTTINDPTFTQLATPNANYDLIDIVECDDNNDFKKYLVTPNHTIPFRNITKHTGVMRNMVPLESEDTHLMRKFVLERGFHIKLIDTFNHWILVDLPNKITSSNILINNTQISFSNVSIMKPCSTTNSRNVHITPRLAREQGHAYVSTIYADITVTDVITKESQTINYSIAETPIIIGCVACHLGGLTESQRLQIGECPKDQFGYFLPKGGHENVVKCKDRLLYFNFLTYSDKSTPYITRITTPIYGKSGTTLVKMSFNTSSKREALEVWTSMMNIKNWLDVFTAFRILGKTTAEAQDIINMFVPAEHRYSVQLFLSSTLIISNMISDDSILTHLNSIRSEKRDKKMYDESDPRIEFTNDLFSSTPDIDEKILLLGMMVARTSMFAKGLTYADDRDSWSFKKCQVPADVVRQHFNQVWSKMMRDIKESLTNDANLDAKISPTSVKNMIFGSSFAKNMSTIFAPMNKQAFGINSKDATPPAEQYDRITTVAGYGGITKISAPTIPRGQSKVRKIQPSQAGFICPADTTDGNMIGLTKAPTPTSFVAVSVPAPDLSLYIEISPVPVDGFIPLYINARIPGWISKDTGLMELKNLKRSGILHYTSCVLYNSVYNMFEVYTEDSRMVRPLLVVDDMDGQLVIDKKQLWKAEIDVLIAENAIEYISPKMQEYAYPCTSPIKLRNEVSKGIIEGYSHCEIHPNAVFSYSASIVPWANTIKGPRFTYQTKMYRQALDGYHYLYYLRQDTTFKMLMNPQQPICGSDMLNVMGIDSMPAVQNTILAIMAMENNNEDALVVKKESLKGYYFRIGKYMSKKTIAQGVKSARELIAKPVLSDAEAASSKYSAIGEDGLPRIGARVKAGDCITGKIKSTDGDIRKNELTGKYEVMGNGKLNNSSSIGGIDDYGFVTRVTVTTNADAEKIVVVQIMHLRQYEHGDKFSSRYSQKGTIGDIIPACKLPMIADGPSKGLVADLMFGPLGFPSRMTVGKFMEILENKASLHKPGRMVNCTTFNKYLPNEAISILKDVALKHGFGEERAIEYSKGKERMVRANGKLMKRPIFVGPCSYQTLKQHTRDKIQSRALGALNNLTKTPVSRRKLGGGLRLGSMEADAIVTTGASKTIQERLMKISDPSVLYVCRECGNFATMYMDKEKAYCDYDESHTKIGVLDTTYISTFVNHRLKGVCFNVRYITEPVEEGYDERIAEEDRIKAEMVKDGIQDVIEGLGGDVDMSGLRLVSS